MASKVKEMRFDKEEKKRKSSFRKLNKNESELERERENSLIPKFPNSVYVNLLLILLVCFNFTNFRHILNGDF